MVWWKSALSKHSSTGMTYFLWALLVLPITAGSLTSTPLYAEDLTVCPEASVDECTRYQRLMAGIDSGDLIVQLASLRAASQELDPALRTLIFEKALKSDDLRLRTAGLRYVLASRSTFDVVVELPVHPTPAQQRIYEIHGLLTLSNVKIDEKTDEIKANIMSRKVKGSMIRGGFEISWPYCRLRMIAGEEDVIQGTLRCMYPGKEQGELKTKIELS